jgi:serine/threonine protein kinase
LKREDEYAQLLLSQKLWPVDPMIEQNWSGRGQHAKFEKDEQKLINKILEPLKILGSTRTAVVQSVKCRRILLARKTIICSKQTMKKEEAIAEVAHLTRLDHSHIVRVIGTYVKGRELSILLYPVAQYNLESFIEEYRTSSSGWIKGVLITASSLKFYSCLSSAVQYIHCHLMKHMDIKPQNILVRESANHDHHIFIADFGIARSYATSEDIETDGRTSFSKRYAAPEVVKQDLKGLAADIFSLGCVFLEILLTFQLRDRYTREIQEVLESNTLGDTSYQANIDALQLCLIYLEQSSQGLHEDRKLDIIAKMLKLEAGGRPTAEDLVSCFGERPCCTSGSVKLEAMTTDEMDYDS